VPHLSALAVGLALGSTALLSPAVVHAQTVEQRLAALEAKLACVKIQEHELIIDGCNLHIRNGSGQTVLDKADTRYQGFGNLIVGYNEKAGPSPEQRLGSHNVVIGGRA
jgi:hypothetical protein